MNAADVIERLREGRECVVRPGGDSKPYRIIGSMRGTRIPPGPPYFSPQQDPISVRALDELKVTLRSWPEARRYECLNLTCFDRAASRKKELLDLFDETITRLEGQHD